MIEIHGKSWNSRNDVILTTTPDFAENVIARKSWTRLSWIALCGPCLLFSRDHYTVEQILCFTYCQPRPKMHLMSYDVCLCRGKPAWLSCMVRPGSDIRDSKDAVLLFILLQTSTDAAVRWFWCLKVAPSCI